MVFWASILAGGLFAWLAIRIGFYEIWAMLFNIVISIYMAIFLTPVIVDVIPAAGDTSYGNALTLAATATGAFLVLFGISYVFLTGQFSISFPKIFDIVCAGLLGFLAGALVFSFAALIITAAPISQNSFVSKLGFNPQSQRSNISYICWWCDLVDMIASSPDRQTTSEQTIDGLLSTAQSEVHDGAGEQNEPNQPAMFDNVKKSPVSHAVRTGAHLAAFARTRPARACLAGRT